MRNNYEDGVGIQHTVRELGASRKDKIAEARDRRTKPLWVSSTKTFLLRHSPRLLHPGELYAQAVWGSLYQPSFLY